MKRLSILLALLLFASLLCAFTSPGPGESFVYPSPVTGNYAYLAFDMAESGSAHLLVYNESGSLVFQQLSSYPAGVQQVLLDGFLTVDGAYVYLIDLNYGSGNSEKISGKFAVVH